MGDSASQQPSEFFWNLKWLDVQTNDSGYFLNQDDFEKHSVVHKKFLMTVFGSSYNEAIKETKHEDSKCLQPPQKTKVSETYSSLSAVEQRLYLHLFKKYCERICSSPTTEEKKEIQKLGELHAKVVLEQEEVNQHLKKISIHQLYRYIHPEALRYLQLLLKTNLDHCLSYPRHYKADKEIEFPASVEEQDKNLLEIYYERQILELGKIPRLVNFPFDKPCVLPLDCTKIEKRFPLVKPVASCHPSKKPVNEDSIAKALALKYDADVVLSASSLKVLLDNRPPDYEHDWDLPICVQECSDSNVSRKVVFIDKAIARSRMSGRERNNLYFKFALKTQLTHINPTRSKVFLLPNAVKVPSNDNNPERRSLPVVDTDLFGDSDAVDLDTFGATSVNVNVGEKTAIRVPESLKRTEENVKEVVFESPASPDAEPVDDAPFVEMRVVNVDSSADEHESKLRKPGEREHRTNTGSLAEASDSDSDALVIDLNSSTSLASSVAKGICDDVLRTRQPEVERERNTNSVDSDSDSLVINTKESSSLDLLNNAQIDSTVNGENEECSKSEDVDHCINKANDSNLSVSSEDSPSTVKTKTLQKDTVSGVRRSPRNRKDTPKMEEFRTPMVLRSRRKDAKEVCDEMSALKTPEESDTTTDTTNTDLPLQNETSGKQSLQEEKRKKTSLPPANKKAKVAERLPNNLGTEKNPLDSILELQKELLCSQNIDNFVATPNKSEIEGGHGEKTCDYPAPDPKDNVIYSLVTLNKLKLLIRHKVDCIQMPSGQAASLHCKLEYHSDYGAEMSSVSDLIDQWVSLILKPGSCVVTARIDAKTAHVLMTENLDLKSLHDKNKNKFQPEFLVKQLAQILESLLINSPGQYLACHKRFEPKLHLYKATENNQRGAIDLHILLQQRQMEVSDGLKVCDDASCWLPLDTEVLLPSLVKCGRVPATFPPQGFISLRNDKTQKSTHQLKKQKRKRRKKLPDK